MNTVIDKDLLKTLRIDINTALASVAEKHKVTLSAGTASYDPAVGTASYKLNVVALGDGGKARDIPAELFIQNAAFIGLKPEHLGKSVSLQGRSFTVTGYKPKARKNCVLIKDTVSGKVFVTTADTIKRQLTKA